jgi:hypothetical protein
MSSTTADVTLERESSDRQHRLATAVRGLRTKAGGTDQARILLLAGGILIPLGIVFIVLGWIGASHTVNLYEQIPYMISGGLLGLGMVFAGGFCYFAYWLTQLVYAARRDAADSRIVLERIESLLSSGNSLASVSYAEGGMTTAPPAATSLSAVAGSTYLATPTGTMFHLPSCPAVAGRDNLREVQGDEAGLTPCKICEPLSV